MSNKPRLLGMTVLLGTFTVGFMSASRQARTEIQAGRGGVVWDDQAAEDVAHTLHHMHELINEGKFDEAAKMIAGDDVLMTFELGLDDNSTPVVLRSKEELFRFMKQLFEGAQKNDGVTIVLDRPRHSARATENIGIVTEECTVRFRYANGEERVDKLFGTNVAVKYPDGWKFIQWHMSVAEPPKYTKAGSPVRKSSHAH